MGIYRFSRELFEGILLSIVNRFNAIAAILTCKCKFMNNLNLSVISLCTLTCKCILMKNLF